jgi:hypothetical protein
LTTRWAPGRELTAENAAGFYFTDGDGLIGLTGECVWETGAYSPLGLRIQETPAPKRKRMSAGARGAIGVLLARPAAATAILAAGSTYAQFEINATEMPAGSLPAMPLEMEVGPIARQLLRHAVDRIRTASARVI